MQPTTYPMPTRSMFDLLSEALNDMVSGAIDDLKTLHQVDPDAAMEKAVALCEAIDHPNLFDQLLACEHVTHDIASEVK